MYLFKLYLFKHNRTAQLRWIEITNKRLRVNHVFIFVDPVFSLFFFYCGTM